MGLAFLIEVTTGFFKARGEPSLIQPVNAHLASAVGRVNKALIANVDTHMGITEPAGIEKDQISRPNRRGWNLPSPVCHIPGTAFDPVFGGLPIEPAHHAAAIQSRLRVLTPKLITRVDKVHGHDRHFLPLGGGRQVVCAKTRDVLVTGAGTTDQQQRQRQTEPTKGPLQRKPMPQPGSQQNAVHHMMPSVAQHLTTGKCIAYPNDLPTESFAMLLTRLKDPTLLRSEAYINGQWHATTRCFEVIDPGTGTAIAQVANLGDAETRLAIDAAEAAFPAWRAQTARTRDTLLRRWYDLIQANKEDLATLITAEGGKTYTESLGEVAYAASFVEWFSEQARRVNGEILPSNTADKRLLITREPVGVCAAITPWNFPAAMITRKVAPALAVGCTVVVKPAEQTPLTALALAVLAARAGMPPGVFNVVTGDADAAPAIGGTLTGDARVRKLSFTGSTQVGRLLMAQSAPSLKRLSLELGGNAPFIVFEDADLDAAVDGAIASKYRNSGQVCVSANRILVQQNVMDAFAEKLTAKVQALKVGHGFENNVQIGPLIDASGLAKVQSLVADAVSKGATVLTGGKPDARGGLYFQPTVIKGVTADMRMKHEEIFGPVAPLYAFSTEAEAIRMANDTEFGLAAYFYTRDAGRIFRVSEALEYGMVGVNTGLMSSEVAPFGGVKQSGYGREGSQHGVDEYLSTKYTCLAIE